ncbi:hypothetical protein DM01DRAFT_1314652 [Hesseltinella vesiculosa]|uniref:ABC transporter domain-containing protein n=1 Tax=Hesseltinella vesiculosa TaxID=101127 RepID=A0A1X2GXY5_9FUNG|nr:hypothetical protein DM01DRAFT_1314652 [Hesseltinella vesiculosa]
MEENASRRSGSTSTVTNENEKDQQSYGVPNEVHIQSAVHEYHELKKELSRLSRQSVEVGSKLEEGQAATDDFNLDDFLHTLNNDLGDANIARKRLGVTWRNLSVQGFAADAHTIPNVFSFVVEMLQFWKYFGIGISTSRKQILRDLNGFCKDGEMLLVLGRPGAGCTSLLRVIANMRDGFTDIDGDFSYGGIDAKEFGARYRGQVCYNSEEDLHYPTLTLKQTLQFALRTKTPGTRLPDETKKEFVNKVLYMLGNMLGLTKQMNTLVGNAFVRGLSGGERKRLSIAEQMTTASTINCWDCSTRGLDAASALDFVRSLRIMTDIFHKTTVATLYQASNNIYNLFDKVMVLDEGRCIYFGPTKEAKSYFQDLGFYCPPRKSVADFLTGLCNPLEREYVPGYEKSAPQYASDFERCYRESSMFKRMIAEQDAYEQEIQTYNHQSAFSDAIAQEHQKHTSKRSPYIASFYAQVKALTIRQYHLLIKDRDALVSRYGSVLIQSLISASCFFKMPLTGSGAFTRGGALFTALLFNAFISQSELVNFLTGRSILDKHKHYAMYRPSAYYLAQVILDIPFAIVQVLLFEICAYFMMGLKMTAGAFFTFFIVLFFTNMMMNGFFRLFGAISPSFFIAAQVSGVLLVALVSYVGKPFNSMHPWLSWIYWFNPFTYGFKALLINELQGQIYSCDGPGNSIPYGPGYDDWNYRTCTMQGGVPGESFVLGDSYLRKYLSYEPSQLWAPDFLVVVGYFILFTFLTAMAMEHLSYNRGGNLTRLYLPGKAPKPRTEEEEEERLRQQNEVTKHMDQIATGTTFTWQHINYTVPYKGDQLQLLNDIGGIVKPGHLTALMGSSGAGKTTLLDVLARRKTIGKVDGRVYLNGEHLMSDFERITGYCEQMDIHQPAITVREALRFSAYLRQSSDVPKAEKDDYVEKIILLLEMEDIADAQIGDVESGFGISVEERKRLTIGMELVGKPQLLFLDEPTSGLDAQSSFNIIRFIRKLADAGWPVLCTIHQPSAVLFEYFDHLLLLVRGGRTAYHGPIGPDARTMIDYFESNGGPTCSPEANPAEYILEVVGAGTSGKVTQDWADIWTQSKEAKALQEELELVHSQADTNPSRKAKPYATNYWTQFMLVHKRMATAYWRAPDYNVGRFINVTLVGLLTGFTFYKLGNTTSDMQNKLFCLLSTFIMAFSIIVQAQPRIMIERTYMRKDVASRYYSWFPWSISAVLVEIPYILVYSMTFMMCLYWPSGMTNTSEACGYFFVTFLMIVLWAVSLGFCIAAVSELPTMAAMINPILVSVLMLFSGLMAPPSTLPYFWRSWMYPLDPFHWYLEGLGLNELENLTVECNDNDLVRFSPPPGQTCGQYTEAFFSSGATGYLSNPNATAPEQCGYCKYNSGAEYMESTFQWELGTKWRNFGFLVCYFIFNVIVFIGLTWLRRRGRR